MAASNRMTIDLEGFDALTRAFNSLPGALQNRFLRPALRAGAKVMLKSVQRTAPRSDQAPHVDMTLKIKAMKRKRGRVGFVVITGKREALGIKQTTDPQRRAYNKRKRLERLMKREGASAGGLGALQTIADLKRHDGPGYYPAHIEYGYTHTSGRHIPANPFMKRGLEQGRAEATEAIAQELSRRLKDSVGLSNLSDADLFGGPDVEEVV